MDETGNNMNFIEWESHSSTWTSEPLRSRGKKYMEECIIIARYFDKIMETMIWIYHEKMSVLSKFHFIYTFPDL